MKVLDAGAYGVICPMINTREDAQKLVHFTHCAPQGTRSFGPIRASLYDGADYPQHANKTIVTFAMIETAQALHNLDAILSVEGLDAIYIGPSDLSLSLGCKPVFDDVEPKAQQAIEHIVARAKARGVVAWWRGGRHSQRPRRRGSSARGPGLSLRHAGVGRALSGRRFTGAAGGNAQGVNSTPLSRREVQRHIQPLRARHHLRLHGGLFQQLLRVPGVHGHCAVRHVHAHPAVGIGDAEVR